MQLVPLRALDIALDAVRCTQQRQLATAEHAVEKLVFLDKKGSGARARLEKRLRSHGLPVTGSIDTLARRDREFVMKWNAGLDGAAPRSVRAIADEILAEERGVAAGMRKGAAARFFAPKPKDASETTGEAVDDSCVPVEGDSFETLIRKVRTQKREREVPQCLRRREDGGEATVDPRTPGPALKVAKKAASSDAHGATELTMAIEPAGNHSSAFTGVFDVDTGRMVELPSPPSIPNSPPSSPEEVEDFSASQVERELDANHWQGEAVKPGEDTPAGPHSAKALEVPTQEVHMQDATTVATPTAENKQEVRQMAHVMNVSATPTHLGSSRVKKRERTSPGHDPCRESIHNSAFVANGASSSQALQLASQPRNSTAQEIHSDRFCTPPEQRKENIVLNASPAARTQGTTPQSTVQSDESGGFHTLYYRSGLILSQSPSPGGADTREQRVQSRLKTPLSDEQRRRIERNKQLAIEKKKRFLERQRLGKMRQPDL